MRLFTCFILLLGLCACTKTVEKADVIFSNGTIYTASETAAQVSAFAVKDGRILAMGTDEEMADYRGEATQEHDLNGAFAMPGFIEGHGHFSGLGFSLINLNFLTTPNWDEVVAMVAERAKTTPPGEWIIGRGWHQEKWTETPSPQVLGYPYHDALSAVSPDHPVLLRHASGHGLFANAKAMELAGITAETESPRGGEIVRDVNGTAIGVFEERAMSLIMEPYYEWKGTRSEEEQRAEWYKAVELAQDECLRKGITSFQDAGSSFGEIERYQALAESDSLRVRLWAMLRHSSERMRGQMDGLPVVDLGGGFFTCRAIKSEVDGALGSYGAWLLRSYQDKPNFDGQNTTTLEEVGAIAEIALAHDMQLCVHAIGDRANREVLNIMEEIFEREGTGDRRWRIEHAQHLSTEDIERFDDLGVIAAMQAIHCTSDAPFVVKRLGVDRARTGAYAWRRLLDAGAVVTNGTDAPVEDVDPLPSFYATITRKRADTGLEFFPEGVLSREEAIHTYTVANAYAAFEEKDKGTLEVGKFADMVVLSNNLLTCPDEAVLDTEVLMTVVGGEVAYSGRE